MSGEVVDYDSTNFTIVTNGTISVLSLPDVLLSGELREIVDNERAKLRYNEETREAVWSKFLPLVLVALFVYIFLSSAWLLYNYYSYRRQKLAARQHKEIHQTLENQRLLQRYSEIPTLPGSLKSQSGENATTSDSVVVPVVSGQNAGTSQA
ncbi:hypothetical protein AAVH_12490 [Aphelenchoides avenae]|nr:hypothetical protein AAVH_12490 [Aphelenchus avenae]